MMDDVSGMKEGGYLRVSTESRATRKREKDGWWGFGSGRGLENIPLILLTEKKGRRITYKKGE